MKNKKIIFLILIVVCICFGAFWVLKDNQDSVDYVMKINDMNVSLDEVIFALDEKKHGVKNHLINMYNIQSGDFDWKNKYGDKKGYEYLKESLLENLKEEKIVQEEAIRLKIIDQFDYSSFLEIFEEENELRKEKEEKGEVYFGPTEYSEEEYYKYYQSNLLIKVNRKIVEENIIEVTDEEIRQTYLNEKNDFGDQELENVKNEVKALCQERKIQEYFREKVNACQIKYMKDIDSIIQDHLQ